MKTKLFKRFCSLTMALVMLFSLSATAFAAEPTNEVIVEEVTVTEDESAMPLSDAIASGTVGPWGTITIWPHLSSYLGLSKTITIVTRGPESSSGAVHLTLKKSGKVKSNGWVMGVRDQGTWKLTLPESGDYELIISNHSDYTFEVTAQWN